jgi:RNA polymerase sigma-70 factor, ECF subfamily
MSHPARAQDPDRASLQAWACCAVERGREAWPEIAVGPDEVAWAAGLRLAEAALRGSDLGLESLDAAELCLAVACARGDATALSRLRARYFETITGALRRMGLGDAQQEDVWQVLCERLLVSADGAPARIIKYAGTGDLSGLVRVAATRVALNWLEQEKRRRSADDWLHALPDPRSDPELHLLKDQHRAAVKVEIEAVVASLPARDRAILRLHMVERVGIDEIAGIYAVHRATAARWVAHAKESLARQVRDRLVARWRVDDSSLPLLKSLIDSQLDLSLERLLAAD